MVVSGAQGAGITGNAGKARVYGVEYDADLKLDKFTISTSGAYNDAALDGVLQLRVQRRDKFDLATQLLHPRRDRARLEPADPASRGGQRHPPASPTQIQGHDLGPL